MKKSAWNKKFGKMAKKCGKQKKLPFKRCMKKIKK